MTPYIFGVEGKPGVGKTTVIERIAPELVRRGHRVGIVRCSLAAGAGAQPDQGRLAGMPAAVAGPEQFTLFPKGLTVDSAWLASALGDVDLVLVEGCTGGNWPKLEVHSGRGPLLCAGDPWLMAVTGPVQPRRCPVPWYHWDEVLQLANLIENARSLGMAGGARGFPSGPPSHLP
jgi:molybdopterin-guanine dinucleotide biosynthesis protein MobB